VKIEEEDDFLEDQKGSGSVILFTLIGCLMFWATVVVVGILVLKHFNII
jgi:hypothetical protein